MDKSTYDESLAHFGEKLKKARKDVGMTQDRLSELSGVSQSMIAQYESGMRYPGLRVLRRLSCMLGVSITDLIEVAPRCQYPEGVTVEIGGHEVDPCLYVEDEKYENVTVTVLRCKRCGHIEIEWTPQENTRRLI